MTIEMKDELELTTNSTNLEKEKEVSTIIKLFQFSNLNLYQTNLVRLFLRVKHFPIFLAFL